MSAAQHGADAIGLICYEKAPRFISRDRARAIAQSLPPFVTPVAVFVDADAPTILESAQAIGVRTVQLNGSESPDLVRQLHPLTVIKAVRAAPETIDDDVARWTLSPSSNFLGIVFEPAHTDAPGGSGVVNDWQAVRCAMDKLPPQIHAVAAGGLTPDNVADVVHQLHPWAVDVSSGVESSRGIKSPEKIEAFIRAVR